MLDLAMVFLVDLPLVEYTEVIILVWEGTPYHEQHSQREYLPRRYRYFCSSGTLSKDDSCQTRQ